MERKLDFFNASSLLERLSEQDALKLKGGDSDVAWHNDLDEVEITDPGDGGDDWTDPGDDWDSHEPVDDYDPTQEDMWDHGSDGGTSGPPTTTTQLVNQPGYWSYVNGEYVYTVNGGTLNEVTITADGGYSATDAVGVMLSSMGLAADHADVAAAIAKIETRGFSITSKAFGVLGAFQNIKEMVDEGSWNWEDGGQMALGAALMAPGINGGIVLAGGAILFGWELYEMMNE